MARGKSGPRKGHLKTLYDRIAHMEAIVVDADVNGEYGPSSTRSQGSQARAPTSFQGSAATGPALGLQHLSVQDPKISCEDIARLDEIFFRIVYPFVPIIHKDSFPLESGPDSRNKPLKGLRNAMWTLASVHDQNLSSLQDYFYRTARSSLQADELVSDEGVFTLEHCQAWLLVAYYEFRLLKNLKAWLSAGCAIRIAQALGFDRLDGDWSVQTQSPVLDATSLSITERETIRRTFWLLFWADRCGSLALSRSPAIAEYTVSTGLPDFEDAFQTGTVKDNPHLEDILNAKKRQFSPIAGVIAVIALHGRTLNHLQRPLEMEERTNIESSFWKKQREIGDAHSSFWLHLPTHLRASQGLKDPLVTLMHMSFNTSIIHLQQASISYATAARPSVSEVFIQQCRLKSLSAATETASIMRASQHLDPTTLSPFSCFPLYVAARVMLQHLRLFDDDEDVASTLNYLVTALQTFIPSNRIAFMYLSQLLDDIQKSGIADPAQLNEVRAEAKKHESPPPGITPTREGVNDTVSKFMRQASPSYPRDPVSAEQSHAQLHPEPSYLEMSLNSAGLAASGSEPYTQDAETYPSKNGPAYQGTLFNATDFEGDLGFDQFGLENFTQYSSAPFDMQQGSTEGVADASFGAWSFPSLNTLPLNWDFSQFDNEQHSEQTFI